MSVFNKRWMLSLVGLVFLSQSSLVSANLITDYTLEFSDVDNVTVGESFDVDVYLDIPLDSELATFGFDFINMFTHVTFDGFTVADWIFADDFNDVGGLADILGPNGDSTYIATLSFTAQALGQQTISAYGELFENGGGAYFYNFVSDELYDGSIGGEFNINVVPEPSIFSIFLLGVLGLVAKRKVRK